MEDQGTQDLSTCRLITDWYREHGCDHAHCPYDCSHPQPFVLDDGRLVCGRCAIIDHEVVEMVPCTPATCE